MKHADRGTAPVPSHGTRGDIQGLRAVAVGTVVLGHAGVAGFAGGYVGVDVFFVISGFLITGILLRELNRTGRVSVLDFYARRARRILPAAAVTLVATTIAAWAAFSSLRLTEVLHDVVWASLFGANVHFARAGSDYFASDTFVSPVQHFWSLAVEEQFYLVWPAVFLVSALLLPRGRALRLVGGVLVVICAASLIWSVQRTEAAPTSAYFSTFTRAWELGVGALLALAATRIQWISRGLLGALSWLGLGLIAWSCLTFTDSTEFPGSAAVMPVLGAALVLAGGIVPTPYGASLVLDRGPMRRLGDISYSLYLVHWPVLMVPAMAAGHDLSGVRRALLVALAVVLAAISYRWVETPFRVGQVWQRRRRQALALWPAAVAVVMATVGVAGTQTSGLAQAERVQLDDRQSTAQVDLRLAVEHAATRSLAGRPLPKALTPAPDRLREDNWAIPAQCWADITETRSDLCPMGDPAAERTLVLVGDSHMGMWTAPIADLAKASHWRVLLFMKTGCPPYDTPLWRVELRRTYDECDQWRKWAYQEIAKLHPQRIVATGWTFSRIADVEADDLLADDEGEAGTEAMKPGLDSAMARLTAITRDVTVISDTTTLPARTPDCLTRRGATLHTCVVAPNPVTQARNAEWKAAAEKHGARWVNVEDWLCAKGVCPLVVGNVVVYTDHHHLTRTFAARLRPLLAQALRL